LLLNSNGILKTLSFLVLELLLVVTDQPVLSLFMIVKNTWLSMSLTTDSEDLKFYLRRTQRERLRNNSKEKSRKLEVDKEEKFWQLENLNQELISRRQSKLISKRLSLHD